jgi:hypothetical protein
MRFLTNKAKGQESRNVIFTSTGWLFGAPLTPSFIGGKSPNNTW